MWWPSGRKFSPLKMSFGQGSGGVEGTGGISFSHALSAKGSIEKTLASPISLDMTKAYPS
jgi:hypothetical protein